MNLARGSTFLALLAIALCQSPTAQAAKAKIEALAFKQKTGMQQAPEFHMVWKDSARAWVPEPDDEVLIAFEYGVAMKDARALAPASKISVRLDNLDAEVPLRSSGNRQRQTGSVELRRRGGEFEAIKAEALKTCRKVRRSPGKRSKERRFTKQFPVVAYATAMSTGPRSAKSVVRAKTTVRIVIVCDAG